MNVAKHWVVGDMDDDIVTVAERAARDAGLSLEDWLARAIVDAYRKEIFEDRPIRSERRPSPGPLFDAVSKTVAESEAAGDLSEETARLIENLDREAEDSYIAAPAAARLAPLVDEVSRADTVDPHAMPPPSPAIRFGRFAMGVLIVLVFGTIAWAVATSQFGGENKIEEAAITRPISPAPPPVEDPAADAETIAVDEETASMETADFPSPAETTPVAPTIESAATAVDTMSIPPADVPIVEESTQSVGDEPTTEEPLLPLDTERVAVLPVNTPPAPTGAETPAPPLRLPIVKPSGDQEADTAAEESRESQSSAESTVADTTTETGETVERAEVAVDTSEDASAQKVEEVRPSDVAAGTPPEDMTETIEEEAVETAAAPDSDATTETSPEPRTETAALPPAPTPPNAAPGGLDGFVAAAQAGDPDAQHDLALIYVQGRGVGQDYESAAYWFREAALQGNANAQYNLGVMYEQGLGVPKDEIEALLLYLSAAEQGHVAAQYNAGLAYAEGKSIPRNFTEARKWFSAAADQGLPEAQYNLGIIYENGLGVARDEITAFRYYGLATAAGHPEADRKLDRLAQRLTPAERETAMRLVRESLPPQTGKEDTLASAELSRAEIQEVQKLLNALGFDAGPSDGLAGGRTIDAIRQYQHGAGLVVDGRPTSELLDHLRKNAGA